MNIKVYIVHYSPLKERYIFIKNQLDKYALNYEFITNYDREKLTEEDLQTFDQNKLRKATCGLHLSHIYCYKKILNEKYDYYLILEDDVIFCENFIYKLNLYLLQLPYNFDIFSIGDGCKLHIPNNYIKKDKFVYLKNNIPIDIEKNFSKWKVNWNSGVVRCTDSYFISRKCAKKITDYFSENNNENNKIIYPIDWWLNDIIKLLNLLVYWGEPTLVTQASQNNTFKTSH